MEMGAPKDFATKLQAGTGAAHIKSFIKHLKNFEFEKPLGDHAPNQRLIYEPKGICALITPLELADESSLFESNTCYCIWLYNGAKAL